MMPTMRLYKSHLIIPIITMLVMIPAVLGQDQCTNVTLSASRSANYLTSPNYPQNYTSNTDCQWLITATLPTNIVVLKLLDFTLEDSLPSCTKDYVAIHDGHNISDPQIKLLCGQVSNITLMSTGSSLTVVFHSDSARSYTGFRIEYTSQDKTVLCGGTDLWADETDKYIISPGYPNSYPSDMNCNWHITASLTSETIILKVMDFQIDDTSDSCSFDYLSIYDGYSIYFPMIDMLCGQVSFRQFISTGSSMTVVFQSDSSVSAKGFKLGYTVHKKSVSCAGGTLLANENANTLTSPNYPYSYPSNTDCEWHITTASDTSVVTLSFLQLSLDGNPSSCLKDYVKIYDGSNTMSHVITVMCGEMNNVFINSTGRDVTIDFHSDSSNNGAGFSVSYQSLITPAGKCRNITLLANASASFFTSPNYPHAYPGKTDCYWHITSSSSTDVVVLELLDFNLESQDSDYVTIYDGNSVDSPYIENLYGNIPNAIFKSTGSSITVVFHSDTYYSGSGFKFQYTSQNKTAECVDVHLMGKGTTNYITSPGYPSNYSSHLDCQWHITSFSTSEEIILKLVDFNTEGVLPKCSNDTVAVYDGNNTASARIELCGEVQGEIITSTSSYITVVFHSDSANNYKGFKIEYTSQRKEVLCGQNNLTATETPQNLISPNYPNNFPSNLICSWNITSSTSEAVLMKVMDLNFHDVLPFCIDDFLSIGDGDSEHAMQMLCGHIQNNQFTSTSTSMIVLIYSRFVYGKRNFNLQYTSHERPAPCTNVTLVANETVNYLTSPNYPYFYPSYSDCQWHITTGSSTSVVSLSVAHFAIYAILNVCITDYVKIYDGPSRASRLLTVLCGQQHNTTVESTGSDMTIVFHSDILSSYDGFNLTYYSKMKISDF